jgi:hypothetical protein
MPAIVKLQGGLGNQLFQIAFARELATRGKQILLDARIYERKQIHAGFALAEHMTIPFPVATAADFRAQGFARNWNWHEVRRRFGAYKRRVVVEDQAIFDASHLEREYDFYDGYWQDERYFPSVTAEVRASFAAIELDDANARLRDQIASGPSVSVHVRRGDYLAVPLFTPLCDSDYYQRALDHVRERVPNARLFVFSDDLSWCRDNLGAKDAVYVDHNGGSRSIYDLLLMGLCDSNVVANSTFSWWGAWLNPRADRVVVAPSRWFTDDTRQAAIRLPRQWERL